MEENYFLVPITAAFANASLFLLNAGRRNPLNRILLIVYVLLFLTNCSAALMMTAPSPEAAGLVLFVMRHFLFPLPVALLALASFLTGRRPSNPFVWAAGAWAVLFLIAADVTYALKSNALVLGLVERPWGFFPHLAPPALVLLGGLNAFSIVVTLFFLIRPAAKTDTPLPFFDRRLVGALLIVWWCGFFLNGPALSGSGLYPLGNGVDALVSILVSAYLHRTSSLRSPLTQAPWERGLRLLTEALAAAAFGLLFWFVTLAVLGPSRPAQLVLTVMMTVVSLGFLQFLKSPLALSSRSDIPAGSGGPAIAQLERYGLSRQEIRICELIKEGYGRSSMLVFLNISDGTLRNHLKNIYAKTIEPEGKVDPARRDHLQRLTVFLSKT